MRRRVYLLLILSIFIVCCNKAPGTEPIFHDENPTLLSEWNLLKVNRGRLKLSENVVPYTLSTPLFTDYAHKLRTIWIPQGSAIYRHNKVLEFPVGTVISKTFYYPTATASNGTTNVLKTADIVYVNNNQGLDLSSHKLLETRLLIHKPTGWEPVSYIWNDEQTDATLKRIGAIKKLTLEEQNGAKTPFSYIVPNINQCAGCHTPNNTTRTISPIGPKGGNLNIDYQYAQGTGNQLEHLSSLGLLSDYLPKEKTLASWDGRDLELNERARAYLDVNCAHCHNPVGPADTSGLHLNLENTSPPHLGICKLAVAAGAGTGGRKFDIEPGKPDNSILIYRMLTNDPASMMPELGRSIVHQEGAQLIRDWIEKMEGSC